MLYLKLILDFKRNFTPCPDNLEGILFFKTSGVDLLES